MKYVSFDNFLSNKSTISVFQQIYFERLEKCSLCVSGPEKLATDSKIKNIAFNH